MKRKEKKLPASRKTKALPETVNANQRIQPHKKATALKFDLDVDGNLKALSLSDGEKWDLASIKSGGKELVKKIDAICKETSGNSDFEVTRRVLDFLQLGMVGDEYFGRFNSVAEVLPLLQPKDTTEALLAGQFANLQKAGFRYLANANSSEDGNVIEFFLSKATKLLRLANETMQTLVRYRTAGQQVVQVVHMTNNGQAIVAQNLSHVPGGEGVANQNRGGTPCNPKNVEPNAGHATINPVVQQSCPEEQDAECTEDVVPVPPHKVD